MTSGKTTTKVRQRGGEGEERKGESERKRDVEDLLNVNRLTHPWRVVGEDDEPEEEGQLPMTTTAKGRTRGGAERWRRRRGGAKEEREEVED